VSPDTSQALQLRDIHLPAAPPFWPPAPGWWLVAAAALLVLAWLGRVALRRHRLRRQRQQALAALAQFERDLASERSPGALAQISIMLRRLALLRFPRRDVAALTGNNWLRFLDESGGGGRFLDGPGRVLATGPYQAVLPADTDVRELVALVRSWIVRNA
jgi:hypothetical protein